MKDCGFGAKRASVYMNLATFRRQLPIERHVSPRRMAYTGPLPVLPNVFCPGSSGSPLVLADLGARVSGASVRMQASPFAPDCFQGAAPDQSDLAMPPHSGRS
jgi:hypothetical protein